MGMVFYNLGNSLLGEFLALFIQAKKVFLNPVFLKFLDFEFFFLLTKLDCTFF